MRPQLSFAPSTGFRFRALATYGENIGLERLLWSAACFLALALLVAWLARPTLTAEIGPARIGASAGQAYSAGRLFGNHILYAAPTDSLRHKTRSGVALFEDGRALGPAHASHRQIRETGRGAFSHWNPDLLFSSSDGTDPRANGRRYTARVTTEINPLILASGFALVAAAAAGALWLRHRVWLRRYLAHGLAYCRRALEGQTDAGCTSATAPSGLRAIGSVVWPFAPLALVGCYAVAPSVSIDSTIYTSTRLSLAMPHYPPLYPIFTHTVSAAASILGWIAGGPAPHLHITGAPPFTPLAAMLTLLLQHALALASAAYLACRLRPDPLGRRLVVAVLYLNPFTLQAIHSVHSEALAIPAVYAAAAEAFAILARPCRPLRHYAAFLAWTLLASLIRYPAATLCLVLPAGLAVQAGAALLRRDRPGLRARLVALAATCIGAAGIATAGSLIGTGMQMSMGIEPHSTTGRAFTYRLSAEWAGTSLNPGVDKARLARIVEHLKRTTADAEAKQDIDSIAGTPNAWIGPHRKILEDIQHACQDCSHAETSVETDRRLNRVMTHAILHMDADLIHELVWRTVYFLAPYMFKMQDNLAFSAEFATSIKFDPLSGFAWQGRDVESVLSGYSDILRRSLFSIACGITLILMLLDRRRWLGNLSLSLLGTAMAYSFLVSLVTVYIPRYGLFVDQLALIVVVVALAARTAEAEPHGR